LQRPFEIVENGQQLAYQRGVGEAYEFLSFALEALLVVGELGLSALQLVQVLCCLSLYAPEFVYLSLSPFFHGFLLHYLVQLDSNLLIGLSQGTSRYTCRSCTSLLISSAT